LTNFARLTSLARVSIGAGGAQALVQALSLASGILVIRFLSAPQYAFYTIANAALGTMTVLTDSGISSGVLAQAGPHWQDRQRVGAALAAGLEIRRRLALIAAGVAIPLILALCRRQGATWFAAVLVALSILPTFLASITGQLLEAVPRLHQRLWRLQRIQIASNLGRLATLAAVVPVAPFAAVATVITGVPQWIANWRLRLLAAEDADLERRPDALVRQHLIRQLRRTMPGAVYYSLSGQVAIWLIALRGGTTSVASVGALGRLAMAFAVFTAVFNVIIVPRFARLQSSERDLTLRRYWQSQAVLAAACMVPVAAVALFPDAVLAILGPQYGGLRLEALLVAGSSVVGVLENAAYVLAATRGVVAPPALSIPTLIIVQAALIALIPLDSMTGVILIGGLSTFSRWLLYCGYFSWSNRRRAPGGQ
jgi:O-antigen/teichoic acid export membrane protein